MLGQLILDGLGLLLSLLLVCRNLLLGSSPLGRSLHQVVAVALGYYIIWQMWFRKWRAQKVGTYLRRSWRLGIGLQSLDPSQC